MIKHCIYCNYELELEEDYYLTQQIIMTNSYICPNCGSHVKLKKYNRKYYLKLLEELSKIVKL